MFHLNLNRYIVGSVLYHRRYDLDKLVWINKQWMKKINPSELRKIIAPLVKEKYGTKGDALLHSDAFITDLKEECENFNQCVEYINFFILIVLL